MGNKPWVITVFSNLIVNEVYIFTYIIFLSFFFRKFFRYQGHFHKIVLTASGKNVLQRSKVKQNDNKLGMQMWEFVAWQHFKNALVTSHVYISNERRHMLITVLNHWSRDFSSGWGFVSFFFFLWFLFHFFHVIVSFFFFNVINYLDSVLLLLYIFI